MKKRKLNTSDRNQLQIKFNRVIIPSTTPFYFCPLFSNEPLLKEQLKNENNDENKNQNQNQNKNKNKNKKNQKNKKRKLLKENTNRVDTPILSSFEKAQVLGSIGMFQKLHPRETIPSSHNFYGVVDLYGPSCFSFQERLIHGQIVRNYSNGQSHSFNISDAFLSEEEYVANHMKRIFSFL